MSDRDFHPHPGFIPEAENKTIAIRAFVPSPKKDDEPKAKKRKRRQRGPSEWTLIFDTETTINAQQNLRIGAYQLRKADELFESGLFYSADTITAEEQALISAYATSNGFVLHTRESFVEEVFFGIAYELRAAIVGLNLPFDLSRLAVRHSAAHYTPHDKSMRGGFTFTLSQFKWRPKVQIKHLSSRNALIRFATPPRRPDTRFERKREHKRPARRGFFIDIKTLAAALLSGSFGLATLSKVLETEHRKYVSEEHGGPLTNDYLAYCLNDVQTTWECYRVLRDKFEKHGLKETHPNEIISEAGLGKKYLQAMGILPFMKVQPEFPHYITGQSLSAYFGGRSEVRWRRQIKQVFYCDFRSMYPTVFTLMGLWQFVIGQGVEWRASTVETRAFLEALALTDLQTKKSWQQLTTLVRVKPQTDILPVRAKYDERTQTIGLNYLSSETPLWYTLADVIASKLLTGKAPEILEAITLSAKEPQADLQPITIAGNRDHELDPKSVEFFKWLIDQRATVKAKMRAAHGVERQKLDAEQLALKILANATSYGIFVEVNVNDLNEPETRECFGPNGCSFPVETDKDEQLGKYFHPLLATLITGAARLMLATAESLILREGLDWAFCDTDSMAIAKSDDMDQETFIAKSQAVVDWFEPLNPYEEKGSLFKIEDENYGLTTDGKPKTLKELYCLCISSKRYVLFNLIDAKPLIRKASAHGLGQYLPPYPDENAPAFIPAPSVPLSEIGVHRWQYDLWYKIIQADLEGHREEVDLSYHEALGNHAACRYGASSPDLLKWFKRYNAGRPYAEQVKPFNFLISFQARLHLITSEIDTFDPLKRGRRPKPYQPKPVAPFDKDIGKACQNAFDRGTGKKVAVEDLKTYREALAQFHLCPESKFLNGDYVDRGRTERRHIQVMGISHIGKEANKWEEQYFTGVELEASVEYNTIDSFETLDQEIREITYKLGERSTAKTLGISRTTLKKILKLGSKSLSRSTTVSSKVM